MNFLLCYVHDEDAFKASMDMYNEPSDKKLN
jgi:hypothetical protein